MWLLSRYVIEKRGMFCPMATDTLSFQCVPHEFPRRIDKDKNLFPCLLRRPCWAVYSYACCTCYMSRPCMTSPTQPNPRYSFSVGILPKKIVDLIRPSTIPKGTSRSQETQELRDFIRVNSMGDPPTTRERPFPPPSPHRKNRSL